MTSVSSNPLISNVLDDFKEPSSTDDSGPTPSLSPSTSLEIKHEMAEDSTKGLRDATQEDSPETLGYDSGDGFDLEKTLRHIVNK
jgi:hypothetical protein